MQEVHPSGQTLQPIPLLTLADLRGETPQTLAAVAEMGDQVHTMINELNPGPIGLEDTEPPQQPFGHADRDGQSPDSQPLQVNELQIKNAMEESSASDIFQHSEATFGLPPAGSVNQIPRQSHPRPFMHSVSKFNPEKDYDIDMGPSGNER